MNARDVFERIAAATTDYEMALDERFIRGLASRQLGLPAKNPPPEDVFEDWSEPANDEQIVEWWGLATSRYTEAHPEVSEPSDRQIIGGQLFADRMDG